MLTKIKFYIFISLVFSGLLSSCTKNNLQRNPYLQEIRFSIDINLSLPSYNPLKTTGNPVFINASGVGTKGVIVMNTGFNQFRVFEASCPNHAPSSCSTLSIKGQNGNCGCESYEYSLFTGQMLNRPNDGARYYDLLEYSARANGDVLRIYN